jgi:hypothetical protein
MYYVDDSGAVETGYIVFSWIEVTPDGWRGCLRHWLDFRKDLYTRYSIPVSAELHTGDFVGGRGTPSLDAAVNDSKAIRRRIAAEAIEAIGLCSDLQVGTVFRQTPDRGKAFHRAKADVYLQFVGHIEQRLATDGALGTVFMDGNGTDPTYRKAHRALKLKDRRIIEDPLFQGSHLSQMVQMADLTAWSSYQGLRRHPSRSFAWTWYEDHLKPIDSNGGPLAV